MADTDSGVTIEISHIAGHGTFATRDWPAGSVVVTYAQSPSSVADLGTLNHSCDPNLGWSDARTLIALRDISPHTELTVDYATCTDDPHLVLYCHCETYRCRQLIEGCDWQIPQLQRRYAGHWTPVLQRRIEESCG